MRKVKQPRLGIERANGLRRRLALHHDTGPAVHLGPQPQNCLRWKLLYIEAGIQFSGLGHLRPAHTVRLCQLATFTLCGGFRKGMTLLGVSVKRRRATSTRGSIPLTTVLSSQIAFAG